MTRKIATVLLFFSCLISYAQTLKGQVVDAVTKEPLEMVSVYFDNTTIGTTTNENGKFSIDYTNAVQSTLVISFLGYNTFYLSDYRSKTNIVVALAESTEELDEVVINADDGMSRAEKLRWFRKEFLGNSEFGKSCKILNEKDLRFRYDKSSRTLSAWSKTPVVVKNRSLQYEISFDIIDFEIILGNWNAQSVIYTGTSFYRNLDEEENRKTLKNRKKAYEGSIQHFIRAIYYERLEEDGYVFGVRGLKVNPYEYFVLSDILENETRRVVLKQKLDIFYKDTAESVIQTAENLEFFIDKYGNYAPIPQVLFGGAMGKQRIGDLLPLDYGLSQN
ncbi:carboxypeptidase-like protein [Winogradskyella wandonensis]|uniref:Carboxypeptidase-like protein n=1 Tax=Winogradskyella wandonensis TaxID=1442586 RepID=A0A4R1KSN5_9FLAO|nr:carboxypeptidase-like regulatory domain-containing protein [Winogradskyella wandonensis]TCK68044.1 carboxypeptidase-like protein [Winogradskyella wandonensis]